MVEGHEAGADGRLGMARRSAPRTPARLPAPAERSAPMTRAEMDAAIEARRNDPAFQLRLQAIMDQDRAILDRLADS